MAGVDTAGTLGKVAGVVDTMRSELEDVARRLNLLAETVDTMIWRNVVPLDGGMVAISHQKGWFVVPQEEYRSLLHLANGRGSHEPGTVAVMESLVRHGDFVIDVGAHIGLLSLSLAKLVGPEGRLLCLEPNRRSAECIRRMLVCNGLDAHCQILEVAASDEDAQVEYFFGANSMLGSLVGDEGQGSVRVPGARIDSIVPTGIPVDLVKIDAEGFETNVITGMRRLCAENRDMFVIAEFGPSHLVRCGISPETWFEIFFQAGLDTFACIDETTGRCRTRAISDLADVHSVNLLFHARENRRQSEILTLRDDDGEIDR